MSEYCFTSLFAQSWQDRDRRKPKAGTMPYSYFEWLQGFFIVHSTIGSTVHFMHLNSLEHCICTTRMTNIRRRPDQDSNLVPPGYKPQSIRISHRGRPQCCYSPNINEMLVRHCLSNTLQIIVFWLIWPCCRKRVILTYLLLSPLTM